MKKNKTVSAYIVKNERCFKLLNRLRNILLNSPMQETVKWGMPTYTFENKNLIGIGAFKNHIALWFFQGVLLKDKFKLLHNAQEGKTKALRQTHFKSLDEINDTIIKAYILETIENHKAGLHIIPERNVNEVIVPEELSILFNKNSILQNCFNELTTGKKREYAEYIIGAKRETTKLNRIEKIIPMILDKKGLYDTYKKC